MTTPPLAEQRLTSFDRSDMGTVTADRRRHLTLIAMSIAAFMIQLDVTIVNVALPTIQHSLNAGIGQTEWVLSGYALGLAAFIPLAGGLGDRFGHKAIFLGGLILFGAASIGCAIADDGLLLIASRLLQGIGGSAVLALTLAILTQTYPAPLRDQAIGTWAAIGGIGFGLGPVFGGVLLASYGWPSIFWVNLPFTVAAVVLTGIAIPGGRMRGARRPLDGPGIAFASLGLAALTFGLIEATGSGLMSPGTLTPLMAGLLVLGLFFWWQRRAAHPLVPAGLRGARSFIGACVVYFTSYTAFAGTLYYVTMLFQNLEGWSPLQTGLSWLLMNLPFLVAAQLAGRSGRRFPPRTIIVTGCTLAGAGIALLATITGVGDFRIAMLGYLLTGSGFGVLVPGITHVAMRDVPQNAAGAGSAILNCARQLGTATGLAAIGTLGSLATTSRWNGDGSQLPDVIVGRLGSVTSALGPEAAAAFLDGYRIALTACALCLVIATLIAIRAFRPRT